MEVENKPTNTDSVVEDGGANETLDDIIAARVKEAVASSKIDAKESVLKTEEPTDTSEGKSPDVSTQATSSPATDPNQEVIKLLETTTGRKFSNLEDFQKYVSGLNSLVGDQAIAKAREGAKLWETFSSKWAEQEGQTLDEAKKYLAEQLLSGELKAQKSEAKEQPKAEPKEQPKAEPIIKSSEIDKISERIDKLTDAQERSALKERYPEAKEVLDEIAIIAKQKGVSYVEAYENSPLRALVETKVKEESKKSPVVASSNRLGINKNKVQELAQKVLKTGSEDAQVALVKEFGDVLGLK